MNENALALRLYITVGPCTACTPTKWNCKLLIFLLAAIIWYWKLNHDTKLRKMVNQYCLYYGARVYATRNLFTHSLAHSLRSSLSLALTPGRSAHSLSAQRTSAKVRSLSLSPCVWTVCCSVQRSSILGLRWFSTPKNTKTTEWKLFAMRITFRLG